MPPGPGDCAVRAQADLTLSTGIESKDPTVLRCKPFPYFVLWKLLLVASSCEGHITRAAREGDRAHLNPAAWGPQHTPRMWETYFQFSSLERFQSRILTTRPEAILWQRCSHPSCCRFSAEQSTMLASHLSSGCSPGAGRGLHPLACPGRAQPAAGSIQVQECCIT